MPRTNYDRTHPRQQQQTTNKIRWHHGRQWSSNTCMPLVVCKRISNTTTSTRKWTTITNSDQQWDQTLRIQVVYMHNVEGQAIVIPFYVCDVHQPIVSVSRLEEQGFVLTFNEEQRQITHPKGFNTTLIKDQSLYYLRTTVIPIPANYQLQIQQTAEGTIAMIAPTTLTPQGPEPILGGNNDFWTYNNEGYLVRVHKTRRKALFLPYKTCPIPVDKLENYRRTIVRRPDKNNEDFEEQFQSMSNKQQKRVLQGTSLDRRNLVQVEAWHNGANNSNNSCSKEGRQADNRWQTRSYKHFKQSTSRQEANNVYTNTQVYNKGSSKHTTTTYKQVNIIASTINNGQYRRLLDTRRTHVEASAHTTTQWAVHTTADTIWTWHYKAQTWSSYIHVSTRWNKDDKVWWSMDITSKKNDRQDMDRFNKLWRTNNIQRWIHHRWRGQSTSSIARKRHQDITTAYRTRAQRTQFDTSTLSIMVLNMCGEQG